MPNWVQNEIIFENTSDEKVAALIRELKASVEEVLAQKYPDLEFTHRWADEDIGNNCGQMWYSEGTGSDLDVEDERAFAMGIWGYTKDDFDDDDEEYETSYGDVTVDSDSDPEVTEVEPPETVDNGLSISDLI